MDLPLLALALFTLIAAERSARLRRVPAPFLRPHLASDLIFFATGALGLGLAMRTGAAQLAAALGVAPIGAWPTGVAALTTLAAYDANAWLVHWLLHRYEPLWRLHKVHHASPHLDWLATFRAHPIEHALRHAGSPVLLLLLGFPAAHVALAGVVYAAWAALGHANLHVCWGALEWLLITPRLHHLHHVPETSERNLGTIFSLWDRLAGRLTRRTAPRSAALGVPGEEASYPQRWWPQIREPFRARGDSAERAPLTALRPESPA